MKRVLAAALLAPLMASAGDEGYGGGMLSAIARDSDLPVDTGYGVHLLAGKRLTPALLGELNAYFGKTPASGASGDVSTWGLGFDMLYPFAAGGRVRPFLLAGGGAQRDSFGGLGGGGLENSPFVNLGAGLLLPLNPRLQFRAEARGALVRYDEFPDSVNALDYRLNVGLNFGGDAGPRAPASPAADTDRDSVADADDRCAATPAGQAVTDNGCASIGGLQLHLNFAIRSSTLDAAARSRLDDVADALKASPGERVEIAGYTDARGDAQANIKLSRERAEAVRDYLVSRGVDPQRLQAKGYGAESPVDSNDTAEGRRNNRRIELRVLH